MHAARPLARRRAAPVSPVGALALPTVLVLGLGGLGCGPPTPTDLTGPRVLRVAPAGPIVETADVFRVTFSESIAKGRIAEDTDHVVIVPRVEVNDTWLSDIENPPLIDSRKDDLLPVSLQWEDADTTLIVTPLSPLRPATPYALAISSDVRDLSGNPLVGPAGTKATLVYEVTTDAGPPTVLSTTATGVVPPNIKRLSVTFNQPVVGVSRDTVQLVATDGGPDPDVEAIAIDPLRDRATLLLRDGPTCERLTAGGAFELRIEPGIADDAGREMPAQSFPFSAGSACDLVPNQILSAEVLAYDGRVVALFSTSKPSTTELLFGKQGGPLDCAGPPCPVLGQDARVASDGLYLHEAEGQGVTLGDTYQYALFAEDDLGSRASRTGSFIVVELPEVAVNEILPNPDGDEAAGEFIELHHYGDAGAVSLAGWSLQVADKAPCVFSEAAPTLEPRQYLVVGRAAFDAAAFPGLDEARVFRADSGAGCTATALTLSNEVQPVRLLDQGGRPVSVYPGSPDLSPTDSREGQSIDRIDPEAPDVAASFCFGDGPPTPGATNSAVISGCQE